MVKKISVLALAGLLALPAMASAGAGGAAATADVQAQVDALTKQLNAKGTDGRHQKRPGRKVRGF